MTSVVYQRTATSNNALGIGEVPTNDRDESCAIRSELVTNSPNGRLNVGWTKEPRHFGTRKIYIPDSRIDCEGAHSATASEAMGPEGLVASFEPLFNVTNFTYG